MEHKCIANDSGEIDNICTSAMSKPLMVGSSLLAAALESQPAKMCYLFKSRLEMLLDDRRHGQS